MNEYQTEAIANANAYLSNAVLPTYDELLAAVTVALDRSNERAASNVKWTQRDQDAHDALSAVVKRAS